MKLFQERIDLFEIFAESVAEFARNRRSVRTPCNCDAVLRRHESYDESNCHAD